jgi:transposase
MTERIDVTMAGLYQLQERVTAQTLAVDDWPVVGALVSNVIAREEAKFERLVAKIEAAKAAARRTAGGENEDPAVIDVKHTPVGDSGAGSDDGEGENTSPPKRAPDPAERRDKRGHRIGKGHGRNGPEAYSGGVHFFHSLLAGVIGSICAACGSGRLKRCREQIIIRVIGQPIFGGELHHVERAYCPICGRVIGADIPVGTLAGIGKSVIYHWSACSMLLVLHYFCGLPFKRLEQLHQGWGIPLADSNQWQVAQQTMGEYLAPLVKALVRFAIQNILTLRMDDTGGMILEIQQQITADLTVAKALGLSPDGVRTGINASCFYIETPAGAVILYFTGRHHAGEILKEMLKERPANSEKFNKISDGASKNLGNDLKDVANEGICNVHAFLKFDAVKDQFPTEYALVGEAYAKIYATEGAVRSRQLSPLARLALHQAESRPEMEKIKAMCEQKVNDRLIDPRSPLWEAVHFFIHQYLLLTKFLEVPGMPLDTNLCEQTTIAVVRYLGVSFNYQTKNGAEVGDGAMSLVATARASGVEPVAWLAHCLENHRDLADHPEKYFPWACREHISPSHAPPTKTD